MQVDSPGQPRGADGGTNRPAGDEPRSSASELYLDAGVCYGVPVLSAAGWLDVSGMASVEALLTESLVCDHPWVPCDLTRVEYLSPDAVQKLMEIAATRQTHPAPVIVCGGCGQPAEVLAAVDGRRTLPVYAGSTHSETDLCPQLRWAELSLSSDLTAARSARAFVTRVCATWDMEGVLDEVTLLTSELVTNAVVHAAGAAHIALQRCGDRLTIAVRDDTDVSPRARSPQTWDESGRGLQLVEALSCADGTYPRAEGGKVVWCTFLLRPEN